MMKKIFVLSLLVFGACRGFALEPSTVQLRDGSTIIGEVLEMKAGTYVIKTTAMGQLSIPADQILFIQAGQTDPVAAGSQGKKAFEPRITEGKQPRAPKALTPPAPSPDANDAAAAPDPSTLERAQKEASTRVDSMMMDGDFSKKVMGLEDAGAMQDVLGDEETMNAIRNFDYETLMNNEKMKNLMDSPEIKELLGDAE